MIHSNRTLQGPQPSQQCDRFKETYGQLTNSLIRNVATLNPESFTQATGAKRFEFWGQHLEVYEKVIYTASFPAAY